MAVKKRLFGHVPHVMEGDIFSNRIELSRAKVHRPIQAGISGATTVGADSIVLADTYEDDEDYGQTIIYTGMGGRDPQSGQQVTDQILSHRNLALAKNMESGLAVRVIRKVETGYRYDGLYRVEDYWPEKGKSGYIVYRFRLEKIED